MKINILFLSAVILLLTAFQQPVKLSKTKISDHITARLPEDFQPVGEQELRSKYVSHRPPIALYTSPDRQVDFSVNVSVNQWQHFDLPLVKDFYKASLSTLYTDLRMLKEETTELNKHPAALFEFVGTVEGEENVVRSTASISKYHYVAYVLVNGKVAVFTLTAPARQQQQWSAVAEEIMESIRIKKTL
jgi:hypothetical protein